MIRPHMANRPAEGYQNIIREFRKRAAQEVKYKNSGTHF